MNDQSAYRMHSSNVLCLLRTIVILAAWFCIYLLVSTIGISEATTTNGFTLNTSINSSLPTTAKPKEIETEAETPQALDKVLTNGKVSTVVISTAVTKKSTEANVTQTTQVSTLKEVSTTKAEPTSTSLQTPQTTVTMEERKISPTQPTPTSPHEPISPRKNQNQAEPTSTSLQTPQTTVTMEERKISPTQPTPTSPHEPISSRKNQNQSIPIAEQKSRTSLVDPKETEPKNDVDASTTTKQATTSQNGHPEDGNGKKENSTDNETTITQSQDFNSTFSTRTSTADIVTAAKTSQPTQLQENSVILTTFESTSIEVAETSTLGIADPAGNVTAEIVTKSTPEMIDDFIKSASANETEKASSTEISSTSLTESKTTIPMTVDSLDQQSTGNTSEVSSVLSTAATTRLTSTVFPIQTTTTQPSSTDTSSSIKLTDRADPTLLFFAGLSTVLIIIISIVGNTMTFFVIAREEKLKKAASYFIVSLCVSDMLYSVLDLPFFATRYFYTTSADITTEDSLCIFVPFVHYFSMGVSLLSIGLVSVNRFVMVAFSKYYDRIYKKRNTILMILTCWGTMFIFILPTLLGVWGKFGFDEKMHYCSIIKDENGRTSKSALIGLGLSLPLSAIIVSYAGIFVIVHRSESRMRHHRSLSFSTLAKGAHTGRVRLSETEKKVTKMVLVVFVSFLICYIPNFVLKLVDKNAHYANLQIISYILVYISSCINPIIYYIINKEYKTAYTELIVCIKNNIFCRSQEQSGPKQHGLI